MLSRYKITGTKELSKFSLRETRKAQEEEEVTTKDSQTNAVGKSKKKAQYAIYRETAPRKAKRPTNAIIKMTCCLGIPRVGGSS